MPDLFKEWIPSVLETKKNLIKDDLDEKDYNPFMMNRALSLHNDCIFYANKMNQLYHLPKKYQYEFFLHSIRSKKRTFKPWPKKQKDEDIKLIMDYFNYSQTKALEALQILSENQLEELREIYSTIKK